MNTESLIKLMESNRKNIHLNALHKSLIRELEECEDFNGDRRQTSLNIRILAKKSDTDIKLIRHYINDNETEFCSIICEKLELLNDKFNEYRELVGEVIEDMNANKFLRQREREDIIYKLTCTLHDCNQRINILEGIY